MKDDAVADGTEDATTNGADEAAIDGADDAATDEGDGHGADEGNGDPIRVWLVERTYSDDEQNIVILVYATTDGERYLRKERALTSFGDDRPTTAAVEVSPDNLGTVDDEETRERYAAEATRIADERTPDDRL